MPCLTRCIYGQWYSSDTGTVLICHCMPCQWHHLYRIGNLLREYRKKNPIIFYIKHVPLCDITLKISASSLTIRWSCFGAHIMQLSFWIWKYLHSTRCQDLSPALQKVPYLNMSAFGCLLKKHFLFSACSWNPRETIFSQKYFFRRRRCQSSNVYYILASRRTKTTTSPHWMHYHTFLKAVLQQGEFILL